MIFINNKSYRIKRRVDEITGGVRHLTIVVKGFIDHTHHEKRFNVGLHDEEFTGVILRPVYNEKEDTTIFWLYVED